MGYSGRNTPTPPRNFRIIIGAKLALGCLFVGGLFLTHAYHRAATMSEKPQEMDWETLTDKGLTDSSFVTLTNVELVNADSQDKLDEMFDGLDPDADPEDIQAAFGMDAEDMELGELADLALTPIYVVPIGTDPDSAPQNVYIPRSESYLGEAKAQLDEHGTLTGYISHTTGDEAIQMFVEAFGIQLDEDEFVFEDDEVVYIMYPMEEPLDKAKAETDFWLCGLGVAAGLLLCCSGGPSLWCCLFFFVPSIVSLLGYPMRYGRGSGFTRLLYLCTGLCLMGYGYKLMVLDGLFGSVHGNPFLHTMGFVVGFVGLAAFMAVPIQVLCRKLIATTEVKPRKKEPKMSIQAACSLEAPSQEAMVDYRDGKLIENTDESLCPELQEAVDSLSPLGFADPLPVQWQKNGIGAPTLIQLGCDNMVVADINIDGGDRFVRLVSVLHDGIAVITVSKNSPVHQDLRLGTNGYYSACKSNEPIDVISQHLEETAALAEKRNTTVVKIDADETQNVCQLGRRVLADVRAQYGEIECEVAPKNYGRFKFPAQRVIGELASI